MLKSNQFKKRMRMVIIYFSIILIFFLLFSGISALFGETFVSKMDFGVMCVSITYTALVAWAVFFNIPSGRFDFSVGSLMVLSVIIGGNLSLRLGLNGTISLILCIIVGAVLGAISGICYVLFRLPAMVTSLGMTMIFEAFSFILFGGKGLSIIGNSKYLSVASYPGVLLILAIVFLVLYILINYSQFAHNKQALIGGQKIAVDSGINEKRNAILCYICCGALMAIAGFVSLCRTGTLSAKLSMTSIMTMFDGFLPLFIGLYLAKYGDAVSGIFVGSVISVFISTILARMGLTPSQQSIVNAFILLGFLVFDAKSKNIDLKKNFSNVFKGRKKEEDHERI